jgi:hypothetical protein
MFTRSLITTFFLLAFGIAAAAQSADPQTAAREFYRFDASASKIFNRQSVAARRSRIAPSLYKSFQKELARQDEFLKQNPTDKPHFGDGFPFAPLDETCVAGDKTYQRSTRAGKAKIARSVATVPMVFAYPKTCGIPAIKYSLILRFIAGQWLVQDVIFDDGSRLTTDLKRAEY